jgi:hypothetical protein
VLGGGVGGLPGEPLHVGAGGGVDDRSAAVVEHELDLPLEGHEHAAEVDGDEAVELVFGDLVRGLDRLLDASVVEGDVEAAEPLNGRVQRRGDERNFAGEAAHGRRRTLIASRWSIAR